MDKQDRIWQLYARKMAHEASEEELQELADLIRNDPSVSMQLQLLTEFWNNSSPVQSAENDEAFNRIIAQAEGPVAGTQPIKPAIKKETQETKPRVIPKLRPFNKSILRNYAAVAWRNLVRNKSFSVINIAGLALGMVSAVVILLWIFHELSMDQFHSKKDRVYALMSRASFDGKVGVWESTPKPLMATLKNDYPQVEAAARINWVSVFVLHAGSQQFQVPGFITDPDFFNIFDFPLLKGNPKTALSNDYSIVLTEKMARDLFGSTDVMGQTVRIDSSDYFTVTGVARDLPSNTAFNFNYLVPWSYMKKVGWEDTLWHASNVQTFTLLKPGVTEQTANKLFSNIIRKHAPGLENEVFVHPMAKWHLYSNFENGVSAGGNIEMVRLFSIIAGFILVIACINYVNMSTARSQKRAREVGIRKVVGAGRSSLITQFLGESILVSFLAGIIALGLLQPAMIGFNYLIKEKLSVPYGSMIFWLAAIGFILCTGVLAGIYPAFYLSSYKPVRVLKSNFKRIKIFVTPRKLLVTLQFSFAIVLIICTIVIYRQIKHAQQRDPGYNGTGLAYMYMKGEMEKNYPQIREALLKSGAISSIARSSCPVTDVWAVSDAYKWEGQPADKRSIIINYTADRNYASMVGLKLLQGRDIDVYTYPSDSSAVLLNQAAVKLMGFTNPIGQHIKEYDRDLHVVGVINNFIANRPYQAFIPAIIRGDTKRFGAISFRLNRENEREDNLSAIAKVFKKYNPEYPFECFFADETYSRIFRQEKVLATLAALFAGLTISISCLGLFALAACMAESRIKEIGVRKVLGASVARITTLLSKDFLPPVLLSIIIASPVAWWSMDQWLRGYSYRTSISWWVFVFAALLVIFIAIATVSYQTVKAALANPVKSLKTE